MNISNNNIGEDGLNPLSGLTSPIGTGAKELAKSNTITTLDIWNTHIGLEGLNPLSGLTRPYGS